MLTEVKPQWSTKKDRIFGMHLLSFLAVRISLGLKKDNLEKSNLILMFLFPLARKINSIPQLFLKNANAITPIKVYTNVWKSAWKNPTSWAPLTHQKKYFVSLILFTVTRTFLLPWWTILLVIQILVTTGPNWTLRLYWQKLIRKLHPYSGKYICIRGWHLDDTGVQPSPICVASFRLKFGP